MQPPNNITIPSDSSELEYVRTVTHNSKGEKLKEIFYEYSYIVSKSKVGLSLPITESQMGNNLKNNIFKVCE